MSAPQIPHFANFTAEDVAEMEKLTAVPAKAMLLQCGLLPTLPADSVILDNACGAGVVAAVLFNAVGKDAGGRVVCTDIAEGLVENAAEAIVADAQNLPFPDAYFTHSMMNFGIQLIPNSELVLKESFRILQPGGKVGFTWWVHPGWLDDVNAAVDYVAPPIFSKSPWTSKDSVVSLLTPVGFTNIDVQPLVFEHRESISTFIRFMSILLPAVLVGATAEKYDTYMRKKYGDGEFSTMWSAVVITADKP
ncbi:S-adenosyl-L-methionine-dependent methyltransferase [Mycena rebaudengoi]|nr:S-adenosyl-L-methionine-dependent methyltransferase [Mycena rebaudengoi]